MAETSDNQSSTVSNAPPLNSTGICNASKNPQIPTFLHFSPLQHGDVNKLPIMYPMLVPAVVSAQNPEDMNHGPGIYAVPVLPFMGTVAGIRTNTLIPLTYSTPTSSIASAAGTGNAEQSHVGQQQPQQLPPQRQIVVRRFQIAFQLDLLLIVKLAAVIFIFNQEGSKQRLALLVFFASIVYFIPDWSSNASYAMAFTSYARSSCPAQPPRPAARDGQPGAENDNQPANGNQEAENEAAPEARVAGGNQWWGVLKEIQMIVFWVITSLLPGFHNIDHA